MSFDRVYGGFIEGLLDAFSPYILTDFVLSDEYDILPRIWLC